MAQFSNHLKILLTKPTTNIKEAKLVERPSHVRRSVRKREVGVVQASQPHFITVKKKILQRNEEEKKNILRSI